MSKLLHDLEGGSEDYDDYYSEDELGDDDEPWLNEDEDAPKTLEEYEAERAGRQRLKVSLKEARVPDGPGDLLNTHVVYEKSKERILVEPVHVLGAVDDHVDKRQRHKFRDMVEFRPVSLAHMMRFTSWRDTDAFQPRYGHTATLVGQGSKQCILFFGGQLDRNHHTSQNVQVFDGKQWRHVTVRGSAGVRRSGHTATLDASGDRLILIGGHSHSGQHLNSIDVLHGMRTLSSCHWNERHDAQWHLPANTYKRSELQAQYVRQDWCGCNPNKYPHDTWRGGEIDHRKQSSFFSPHWAPYPLSETSASFPPRSRHTCVLRGHSLVVFGGINERNQRCNDVWLLDLHNFGTEKRRVIDTGHIAQTTDKGWRYQGYQVVYEGQVTSFSWSSPKCQGEVPSPRASHTACLLSNGRDMLVVGGSGSEPDEVFLMDPSGFWRRISVRGLPALSHHSMTAIGSTGRFLLFGGFGDFGTPLNNAFVLDTNDWTCSEINIQGSAVPSARVLHTATLLDKKLFISCGMDGSTNQEVESSMHVLTHPFDSSGFISTLGLDLLKAFDREAGSDVCFVVGGRQIFCHRIILACRSETMRKLFAAEEHSTMDENGHYVIKIAEKVSYHVFLSLLRFMYSDRISVKLEDAKALMDLAHEYGLAQLAAIAQSCGEPEVVIPPSRLNTDLGFALGNPILSDVVVSCEGVEIPCHRVILMQRSEYFRAMLSAGFKEEVQGRIELPDDLAMLRQILQFIYTDTVSADPQTAFDMLCQASIYQIAHLMERCEQVLLDSIDDETVTLLYEAGDRYASPLLKDACAQFLNRNFWRLSEAAAFEELSEHLLVELLEFRRRYKLPLGSLEELVGKTRADDERGYVDLVGAMCHECSRPFVFRRQDYREAADVATPKAELMAITKQRAVFHDKIVSQRQLGHLASVVVNGKEYFRLRAFSTKTDAHQQAALVALHAIQCGVE